MRPGTVTHELVTLLTFTYSSSTGTHFANDVAWLCITNSLHKLLDCTVVVTFRVQVITVLAMDIRYTRIVEVLCLGEVEREKVERLPVQQIELCRC